MAGTGNVVDWLTSHGYRGRMFRSSSKNLELLERVAKRHGSGAAAIGALFTVIMSGELLASLTLAPSISTWWETCLSCLTPSPSAWGSFAGLILGNESLRLP